MAITSTASPGNFKGASGFHYRRISWASIFAGVLVALGIQLLLSLLGIGIGMGSVNPLRDQNPVAGLGMGAVIWWAVTLLIALYLGGWIAGRLSRAGNGFESRVHGVLVWVVFVLFNVYLLTSAAGSILNTAGAVVSNTVTLAGQGAIAARPSLRNAAQQNGVTTDSSAVQSQLDRLKAQGPEAEARARQVGDNVASALSKAGIYSFFGLLIGAIIAASGAAVGRGKLYNNYYDYDSDSEGRNSAIGRPLTPGVG